jgi:phosphoglycerate dehydrogenase-like enzyme
MLAGLFEEGVPISISLAGQTIGIIGLGHLGTHMARYYRGLNMNVGAWSQNQNPAGA